MCDVPPLAGQVATHRRLSKNAGLFRHFFICSLNITISTTTIKYRHKTVKNLRNKNRYALDNQGFIAAVFT
jgi:hypothetical protein